MTPPFDCHEPSGRDFERVPGGDLDAATYDLTLFVAGASAVSARAVKEITALCELHLTDRYQLHVVDVHRDRGLVIERGVLACPTLIKDSPLPKRVFVGDLSNTSRVLRALDIDAAAVPSPERG